MVCAGRLVAQKRFALALRALAALGPDSPVRLLMLGDGPERDELQTLARRLGIAARVQWAGHVPDIAPALANASALLLTSRYEGYPAVLIEALAAGVPVLTTDCSPALPEILFDASFGRIAAAEPQALAQALHQTMALQPRAEAVAMLVQRHRAQSCADTYLALLDRVVAAKHRLQSPTPPCRA
jgi:glycosyltransferase involved in cell wall biosynthesis